MSEVDDIRRAILCLLLARHEAGERANAVADRGWLLGEVERQARHIAELQEKIAAGLAVVEAEDGR